MQVRATNDVGDSDWSEPATATPKKQAAVPDAPGKPTLMPGDGSLAVTWTAPADGGDAIGGYDVQYCDDSTGCDDDSEWTAHPHTGTATTATITPLNNGTAYQVQVRATNDVGDSDWSEPAEATPTAE